jgi:5-amino-6-(5-phospho-D-ribitylamino)uracil phosphatase
LKFKLIAIDFDGTLLSHRGEVTPRTKAAVKKVVEAGFMVCFATGRNLTESRGVLKAVDHFDSAVFVGGAMVIDTKNNITLQRSLMAPPLAREICAFFESHGQAALAMQDTESSGTDYLISAEIEPNSATKQWLSVTTATARFVPNMPGYSHEHTFRVGIVAPDDSAAMIHSEMDAQFGSRIISHSLLVPAFGVQVLEVFDPAVTKWAGILHIANRNKIDPSEVIAIGDDVNDISMIRNAGLGIAMGNAHATVKDVADRIIGSNREDGLAEFLEELAAANAGAVIN